MTTVDITKPIFTNPEAAREHFEAIRWPDGPRCPYCNKTDTVKPLGGKSMGPGWYHCKDCRRKFTARVGTIYERSHIPMTKWLLATHLMCASKKGMSAHQLHRMLGMPYKTAWFMAHRIREGMRDLKPGPLGGEGKFVEADETYIGGKEKNKHPRKRKHIGRGGVSKEIAFALVERNGRVHSQHVPSVNANTLRPILVAQIDNKSTLVTDDAGQYRHMHRDFARHEAINHGILRSMFAVTRTRILSSRTSQRSSGVSLARIIMSLRNILSVIWPSLTFGTTSAQSSA